MKFDLVIVCDLGQSPLDSIVAGHLTLVCDCMSKNERTAISLFLWPAKLCFLISYADLAFARARA